MHKINIKKVNFNYDDKKDLIVEERCGFGFEDAIKAIESENLLEVLSHPNLARYPHQMIFILRIKKYVYAVPFVYNRSKNEVFLKTMYPSRKLTKEYL